MNTKVSFGIGFVSGVAITAIAALLYVGSITGEINSFLADVNSNNNGQNADANDQEDVAEVTLRSDDWILGNPDAAVKIVEFSDIECPFCARVHPTLKDIVAENDGDVAWVYRHFPLESIHPEAVPAALASECAAAVGDGNDTFWRYLDALIAGQSSLGDQFYLETATDLGLDANAFTSCYEEGRFLDVVEQEAQEAYASGGRGTPHMVIISGDEQVPISGAVPQATLQQIIDELL